MRKQIAAGNWKMNTSHEEGLILSRAIANNTIDENVEIILAVPFTHLKAIVDETSQLEHVHISAQNIAATSNGAYTGEVSGEMLKSISVTHVLIGHSERRAYYNENGVVLNQKLTQAFANEITPIYCCGEPLEVRKNENHVAFVKNQLEDTIFNLPENQFSKLILAYEPIWAIGTGETASPDQAQEMHNAIRGMIGEKYNSALADSISILYGGSVKPANAEEIFSKSDVDGGLVGGASLNAEGFTSIINSF